MRQYWRRTLLLVAVMAMALCAGAAGDQSSPAAAAGPIAAGTHHTCALRADGVRCWGFGGDGRLGYANMNSIGDDEPPGFVGPLDLGAGRTARSISAGSFHGCAVLDNGSVRCWGFGGEGRLGYASAESIGDNETPAAAGPVNLGSGRTATAVSAGSAHSCALLDNGTVRCWGYANDGRLGYANTNNIGDDETPGAVGPVDLGLGRSAVAISAGGGHVCAVLDNGSVRCWGFGGFGQLGYAGIDFVGDDETPGSIEPVNLGLGRTARAISAGGSHTCAVLDDNSVRCWGFGGLGQLGYANANSIGDTETPGSVGPVDLGPGRTARAISAGENHTCALLDDNSVRCWGSGGFGQLGYANTANIGDDETPSAAGPVDLGSGRTATAIASGDLHTCAVLDDTSVRCWGYGAYGRLGYCNQATVGDNETPGSVGPVDLGAGGARCAPPPAGGGGAQQPAPDPGASPGGDGAPNAGPPPIDPLGVEAARAGQLRTCLRTAARRARSAGRRARKLCLVRYGRTPGRVTGLTARALSGTRVTLTFRAPGSNGRTPPAARTYIVKQSRRPIRTKRDFLRAQSLCRPSCRFPVTAVGTRISLTVKDLRPRSTYYYAAAARDNVSNRLGPRSTTRVRTR